MALSEMKVPESPKLYTKRYDGLLGVDFSCDVTEVDKRRTPTGTNMISDDGANPVKRVGWRTIGWLPSGAGKVLKMTTRTEANTACTIYSIAEHGIYRTKYTGDRNPNVTTDLTNDTTKTYNGEFTYFAEKLYVFYTETLGDVKKGYVKEIKDEGLVDITPTVPEVTIGMSPDGSGGVSLNGVNILTRERYICFIGTASSMIYYFYPSGTRNQAAHSKACDISIETWENGKWTALQSGYILDGEMHVTGLNEYKEEQEYTVYDPKVIFTSAHPAAGNEDNIRIKYKPFDMNVVEGQGGHSVRRGLYQKNNELLDLTSTKNIAMYGHTTPDRLFAVSGVSKNKVFYSAVNDPVYFPDNNYITVGNDTNEVKGLVRVSDSLAAIKSDSIYDNTLYIIRGSFLDETMVFTVIPTSAKLGATNTDSIKTLIDEPLFLTRGGIFGIANTYYTTEKTIKSRSKFVDRKLLKEEDLENSCAVVWNKYYILCVNDRCYILDGRKTTRDLTGNTDYQHEAYYWENIPATTFTTYNDFLFFGTADSKICMFNTDVPDRTKYCDNGREVWFEQEGEWYLTLSDVDYQGNPQADIIHCEWSTPLDDDGAPQYFKNLNKKGNVVTLLPQSRTSADVILVKDGVKWQSLERFWANVFDWAVINFAEFPFTSNLTARDDFIKKKVKKYKRLQLVIQNNGMFEPFGILGITKTYYYGNFAK
jgi:hypothetical protein